MPAALALQLTNAGLAAVQASTGTSSTVIATLGLTATAFTAAPTLTALPGQFKQLSIEGGEAASDTVISLTAYDYSDDVWDATGFGLFLGDGTLFAAYSSDATILSKASLAFALLAFDISLSADLVEELSFGDPTFTAPPATEDTRGVAKLATQDLADAGEDDATIITPLKLGTRLAALWTSVTTALSSYALKAVSITGNGLVSGGGDLSQDRTLTVTEATEEQITEGASADTVVTPRRLGPLGVLLAQNGYFRFFGLQICWGRFSASANANTSVIFARAFDNACFAVVASGSGTSTSAQDNWPATDTSTITKTGFDVFSANNQIITTCYIAIGG